MADPAALSPQSMAAEFSGRRLAQSTRWNLVGTLLPLFVVLPAVPVLVGHLGTARFGVLAIAFALIGYTSIFDFGLSRGLTQLVASGLDSRDDHLRESVWTAQVLMLILGCAAAGCLFAIAPWLAGSVLHLQGELAQEASLAFRVLSLGLPTEISSSGLRGVIEAQQRFDASNMVRIPMAVLLYAGPLAVLPFSGNLVPVFGVLAAVRLLAWIGYCIACSLTSPWLGRPRVRPRSVVPVVRLAGWISVSNFLSPILVYLDRFIVAGLLSVAAVAYYATPYDLITKALILASAVSAVLFPAFSYTFGRDIQRARSLFSAGSKYVLLGLYPICLIAVGLASELVRLWLGSDFAARSSLPLQLLALGVFTNGLAAIPFALIQGTGRPDLTAKIHLAEFGPFILLLWVMTAQLGIVGTAAAWTIRVALDMVIMYTVAWRLLRESASAVRHQVWAFVGGATSLILVLVLPDTSSVKLLAVCGGLVLVAVAAVVVIPAKERAAIVGRLLGSRERG